MRDYIDTNYLILVSSDGKKTGLEIFNDRIEKNRWPIYDKTPQLLNIKAGKNVIFYIAGAGEKKQNFIGTAKIKKIVSAQNDIVDPNQELRKVLLYLRFENFRFFSKCKSQYYMFMYMLPKQSSVNLNSTCFKSSCS